LRFEIGYLGKEPLARRGLMRLPQRRVDDLDAVVANPMDDHHSFGRDFGVLYEE